MGIFDKLKKTDSASASGNSQPVMDQAMLADMALSTISDGVVIVNNANQIQLINPAAATMLGYAAEGILGLDVAVIFHFQTAEGLPVDEATNQVLAALRNNTAFTTRGYVLINAQNQKRPISITVTPVLAKRGEKIITFRDISKELEEEGAQTEFISTASHEMRTPVASIEGYLGLALNPSCATIDERARKYLEEAHASSQHLGRLFRDLLDVTKLDDKKIQVHPVPVEMISTVRKIVEGQVPAFAEKNLHYTFGSNSNMGDSGGGHIVEQEVYAAVDVDFLREVLNNLVENAIKYNSEGGGIWVNVRGDGDRVLINVTDTGIGISPDDLKHIFQKFYRADNSQTRTIGGTGLGLYLVRERVEAMGGKVWAESSFGEGSTFYISFPRLTWEEYERRKQVMSNQQVMQPQAVAPAQPAAPVPAQTVQPAPVQPMQPAAPAQPLAQPVQMAQPPVQPAQPMTQPMQPVAPPPAPPATPPAQPLTT